MTSLAAETGREALLAGFRARMAQRLAEQLGRDAEQVSRERLEATAPALPA